MRRMRNLFAAGVLGLGVVAPVAPAAAATTVHEAVIDFEHITGWVSSVSKGAGITGDVAGAVSVHGHEPARPKANSALIFDATCGGPGGKPETCTGGDKDLFKPALGNVLIVSQDGKEDDPNDSRSQGTRLTLDLSGLKADSITLEGFDLLDVEDRAAHEDATVEVETKAGPQVLGPYDQGKDNSLQRFDVAIKDVTKITLKLNGSGAIDNIRLKIHRSTPPDPDVELTKEAIRPAAGSTVAHGDVVQYRVAVRNTTNTMATNVLVRDTLVGDATFTDLRGCENETRVSATEFTCLFETVKVGETKLITAHARVDGGQGQDCMANVARVERADADANPNNNTSNRVTHDCATPPPGQPNVTVAKTATPAAGSTVNAGSTITYSVTVSNTGNAPASDVRLEDTLTGVATITDIADCPGLADQTAKSFSCTFPNLAAGATATVTVKADVGNGNGAGCISNVAQVTSVGGAASNATSGPVTHNCATPPPPPPPTFPEISVEKSSASAGQVVRNGDDIVYTVTVRNTGKAIARDVKVLDEINGNARLRHVSGCPGDTRVAADGATATCVIRSLAPGAAVDLQVFATAEGIDLTETDPRCVVNVASTDFRDRTPDDNTSDEVVHRCDPTPQPEWTLTKVVADGFEAAGSQLVVGIAGDPTPTMAYDITVTNTGDVPVPDVVITDEFVPGLDPDDGRELTYLLSANCGGPDGPAAEGEGNVRTCESDLLPVGESFSMRVVATVVEDYPDGLRLTSCMVNGARAEAAVGDPKTAGPVTHGCIREGTPGEFVFAKNLVAVNGNSDGAVIASYLDPAGVTTNKGRSLSVGDTLTFELVLDNSASVEPATAIQVSDAMFSHDAFYNGQAVVSSGTAGYSLVGSVEGCSALPRTEALRDLSATPNDVFAGGFDCFVDRIEAGETATILFTYRVNQAGQQCEYLTNEAAVTSDDDTDLEGIVADLYVQRVASNCVLTGFGALPLGALGLMATSAGGGVLWMARRRREDGLLA